jgi:hypothetical protein
MLDKLEERISPFTRFRPPVAEVVEAALRGQQVPGIEARGGYYAARVSLVPYGIGCKLHLGQKSNGHHKIEHMECGGKTIETMFAESEKIHTSDPLENEAMRCDMAADFADVTVPFFRDNMRVRFKRFTCEFGKLVLEYSAMGKKELETVYYGGRPNTIRVYNKTTERRAKYRALLRRLARGDKNVRGQKWAQFMEWAHRNADRNTWIDGIEYVVTEMEVKAATEEEAPRVTGYCKECNAVQGGQNGCTHLPHVTNAREFMRDLREEQTKGREPKIEFRDTEPIPRFKLRAGTVLAVPSFESIYGTAEDAVLTRVERQIGADRIDRIRQGGEKKPFFANADGKVTVAQIWQRAPRFDPFEQFELSEPKGQQIDPKNFKPGEYIRLRGVLDLIREEGKQNAWAYLNQDGNTARRLFEKFAAYIPTDEGGVKCQSITRDAMVQAFRDSINRQWEKPK